MNTHRCATCGRTNDHRLISTQSDYTKGPFYPDARGKYPWDVICEDCLTTVAEINEPFEEAEDDSE